MSLLPLGHAGLRAPSSLCPFLLAPGRKRNKKGHLFPSLFPGKEGFYLSAELTAAGSQRTPPLCLQVQRLPLLMSLLPQIAPFLSLLHPRQVAEGTLGSPSLLPAPPASLDSVRAVLGGGQWAPGTRALLVSFPHTAAQKDTVTHSFSTGSTASS